MNLDIVKQYVAKLKNEPKHDEWIKHMEYVRNLLIDILIDIEPELKNFFDKNSKNT